MKSLSKSSPIFLPAVSPRPAALASVGTTLWRPTVQHFGSIVSSANLSLKFAWRRIIVTQHGKMCVSASFLSATKDRTLIPYPSDECHHITEKARRTGKCAGSGLADEMDDEDEDQDKWIHPFRMKIDEDAALAFVSCECCRRMRRRVKKSRYDGALRAQQNLKKEPGRVPLPSTTS